MQIYGILIILIFIAAIFAKCRKDYYRRHPDQYAKLKGQQGELIVSRRIGKNIPYEQCVYNNYMLQVDEGKTCQIDHIVVNHNGIFVLETKNYSGKLYGKDSDQKWRQILAYGKVKNHFYNPVKQNATHMYRLQQLLDSSYPIHGYVVMISSDISGIHSNSVVTLSQLHRKLSAGNNTTLSGQDIEHIRSILDHANVTGQVSNSQHVRNVHKMQADIANNICPRCGAELVARNGKYGQFYGCSNYPECKFVKKS